MKSELKSQNGNTFLYLEYDQENYWLYANWIGYQLVENVIKGLTEFQNLHKQYKFNKCLNDNRALIGPWDKANPIVVESLASKGSPDRLKYMAHVISPGIFGQLSVQDLQVRLQNRVEIKLFKDINRAEAWLKKQD